MNYDNSERAHVEHVEDDAVTFELDVIGGTDATAARVTIDYPSVSGVWVGTAKRHPKDSHDPHTAALLAIARALQAAADGMVDQASRRIAEAERLREIRRVVIVRVRRDDV